MISERTMHELCTVIDYEMPSECGFLLVVFQVSEGKIAGKPALKVDVHCNGSLNEVANEIKSVVASALHALADDLDAGAQASGAPEPRRTPSPR